jgi:hypothetical protein
MDLSDRAQFLTPSKRTIQQSTTPTTTTASFTETTLSTKSTTLTPGCSY